MLCDHTDSVLHLPTRTVIKYLWTHAHRYVQVNIISFITVETLETLKLSYCHKKRPMPSFRNRCLQLNCEQIRDKIIIWKWIVFILNRDNSINIDKTHSVTDLRRLRVGKSDPFCWKIFVNSVQKCLDSLPNFILEPPFQNL